MRRILVLRGGALGDFVVTLPALVALRQRWSTATIELAGNAIAAGLAVECGILNRAHSQSEARWASLYGDAPLPGAFATWLGDFDLVVSYWPDPDGALGRRFPTRAGQQFITAAAMPTRAPAAAHYVGALAPLGIVANHSFVGLPVPPTAHERRTIAIHPGSGSRMKNWPAERWLRLIAELPSPVLLVAGEAEAGEWSEAKLLSTSLAAGVRNGSIQFAINRPLRELVRRFAECRLFLGHDSGVSHLAAACGVPSILLFGPTDPAMWAPPAPHVQVIRRGSDPTAISVDEVREAIGSCATEFLAG